MKISKISMCFIVAVLTCGVTIPTLAQPTFQVYSLDATAGDYGPDQDTWFVTSSSFELWAIGAYHNNTVSLTEATLLLSVPDGEAGTISITGLYGTADPGSGTWHATTSFFPENFNNHYPLQDGVSDFITYDIDGFANNDEDIYDYNADNNGEDPELTGATGEVKEFSVAVTGFTSVHFDMYGLVTTEQGPEWKSTWDQDWEISPGSHDTTFIPAPGAILLGGIGVGLVGWLRRKRAL